MRGRPAAVRLLWVTGVLLGCGEATYVYSPPPAPDTSPRVSGRVPTEAAPGGGGQAEHGEAAAAPRRSDPVVATVNGVPLRRSRLVDELMIRHGKAVLEDLIRMSAVEQEVERAGVTLADEEIENELARGRAAFRMKPGEHATFEEMVRKRYGMSMEGYRGIVRRGLLIRKMILRRERPSEDEIMLWFYQNRDRYDVPAEITVSHIFIAKEDPRTGRRRPEAPVRARLQDIRKGLARGEDFGELARRYSDDTASRKQGGQLGTVNERAARMHLDPAFVEAMMALRAGQAGGPVETRKGYHFIKVTALEEGRKVEYNEVGPRVRVEYMEERAVLLGEVFLRGLMERARITRSFEPPKR